MERLLVTTPIFYANARPHLGHAYSLVLADAIARWCVLKGDSAIVPPGEALSGSVKLSTGTDEHGIKVFRAATAAGQSPAEWTAQIASRFRELADTLGIRYDHFIRTSGNAAHENTVRAVWQKMHEKGDIYKGTFSGWYCASEERFVSDSDRDLHVAAGRQLEYVQEENWMFRLSRYTDGIRRWLQECRPVLPESRLHDLDPMLSGGLADLSVSRPAAAMRWGIGVPGDPSQLVYVWLDALVNYLTVQDAAIVPQSGESRRMLHIVGKDILKFHAVYWPAFLLSLDWPLDRLPRLVVHGHWRVAGEKMSKSLGNVVDPLVLMARDTVDPLNGSRRVGRDALRWFLLRCSRLSADSDLQLDELTACYNNDLANALGNLLARIASPKLRIVKGDSLDGQFVDLSIDKLQSVESFYERHDFQSGLLRVVEVLSGCNRYVSEGRPWDLDDAGRLQRTVLRIVRAAAPYLLPIIPESATMILEGIDEDRLGSLAHLFPRRQPSEPSLC